MSMIEYPKIYGPFKRCMERGPDRNKLIWGQWSTDEFAALSQHPWIWTEKVDGENIRIHWDGHKVTYGSREIDNIVTNPLAKISPKFIEILDGLFPEEVMESIFGSSVFTLFGEGYGAGVKSGGNYRPDMSFILFDVFSRGVQHQLFLKQDATVDIASKLGIEHVPLAFVDTATPYDAIEAVRSGDIISEWGAPLEGIVGKPVGDFLSRKGERIAMKIKTKDSYMVRM